MLRLANCVDFICWHFGEFLQELLHKAELEDQKQDSFYSRQYRNNSRRHAHPHSGSLQDLVDSVNNELISDCDRRHQQHSRYAKNSSSVSSRQREGGSLPNNVNSSGSSIPSFSLSRYPKSTTKNSSKNKADTHDYERNLTNHHRNAVIGESVSLCEETQSSIPSTSASISSASEKTHTVINIEDPEEARHLLAHDSLAQVSRQFRHCSHFASIEESVFWRFVFCIVASFRIYPRQPVMMVLNWCQ